MIKGSRRVKDMIRNKAKGDSGKSQALLRHYAMERFLERLANSPYRDNFVLKGGMLVSSLVGVEQRSTMDIDATVKGIALSIDNVLEIIGEIASVPLDDGMAFEVGNADEIMGDSEYGGVRVALTAHMEKSRIPMKIDISTGDAITPTEVMHKYRLLFEDRDVGVWAYPVETVLAEKIETALARGILNTRMRDFYDVFMLRELGEELESSNLRAALEATIEKRGSNVGASTYALILSDIEGSSVMGERWRSYGLSNEHASSIAWSEAVGSLRLLCDMCWSAAEMPC
ncbi:MAG: nucleotidyl transferase AbiEii/AbiGii toxin family protein [Eggerthellaceae bacterium]|nr:nucleotidyl transferase AbiEii/AbiGii toxin family protein [Eggerthellaceae bacterium]